MTVITTFCENEKYYYNDFIKWYTNVWGADQFIFFRGTRRHLNFNHETHGVEFFVEKIGNCINYWYPWAPSAPLSLWFLVYEAFSNIIKDDHPGLGLFVDCDEFLYSKNVSKLKAEGKPFNTHFYEYVPKQPFNISKDCTWSKIPLYYREQAIGGNSCSNHSCCKFYTLDSVGGCHHAGENNIYCNNSLEWNDYDNICFHVGVHSQQHFIFNKHALQIIKGTREMTEHERMSGFANWAFNKFYNKCSFETFELNISNLYSK